MPKCSVYFLLKDGRYVDWSVNTLQEAVISLDFLSRYCKVAMFAGFWCLLHLTIGVITVITRVQTNNFLRLFLVFLGVRIQLGCLVRFSHRLVGVRVLVVRLVIKFHINRSSCFISLKSQLFSRVISFFQCSSGVSWTSCFAQKKSPRLWKVLLLGM